MANFKQKKKVSWR